MKKKDRKTKGGSNLVPCLCKWATNPQYIGANHTMCLRWLTPQESSIPTMNPPSPTLPRSLTDVTLLPHKSREGCKNVKQDLLNMSVLGLSARWRFLRPGFTPQHPKQQQCWTSTKERECKGRLCRDNEDTMLPRATVSHAATKVPLSAAGIALSCLLYIYRPGIKNSFCGTWCSAGGGSFLFLAKLSFAPGHMMPPRAFSYQGIKQWNHFLYMDQNLVNVLLQNSLSDKGMWLAGTQCIKAES